MGKPLILLGAGGHAGVLLDILMLVGGRDILGYSVGEASLIGQQRRGLPVLSTDDELPAAYPPEEVELVNGLGSVGDTSARRSIYQRMKGLGYNFASVIHPKAIVAQDVQLAEGVQVMAAAVIQPGSKIGVNAIINTAAVVDHDCVIGDHAHLAGGVTLSGGVHVGEGVHVGTGASVIQNVNIGAGATVGAGALVVRDVPLAVTVIGVPAREKAQ